jgi:hypothetical protein
VSDSVVSHPVQGNTRSFAVEDGSFWLRHRNAIIAEALRQFPPSGRAWRKLGLIFVPPGNLPWMRSHATNPVPEARGGDIVRVYFSSRDDKNRSHIGWVDLDMSDQPKVIRVADEPLVVPGPRGGFDDSGATMGCLVHAPERTYLYYLGWNLGVTVPWRIAIGLAIREGRDGPFVKHSPAPVLDRSAVDPYSLSYPFVLREGSRWRMWYGTNLHWGEADRDFRYVIRYAESADGIRWNATDRVALDFDGPGEYALARPCVEQIGSAYRMWFCSRGDSYRLGVAVSSDGMTWRRQPLPAGLDVSPEGWDSEMIGYPALIVHKGRRFLFYNGNRFGQTGFGVAVETAE